MALRARPTSNVGEYTVSELAGSLKRTVEDAYGQVRLRGEISGFRGPHGSGHSYFSIKDERAVIDAIVWKGKYPSLRQHLQEGLEVVATGKVTTYPNRSKYQIVVEALEPAGEGALMALLEARKRQLAGEGLFAPERKRALPHMPRTVGIVTSPTGAVIRDILHRLAERYVERVLVWPVRVQGDGAADEIARAIRGFNAMEGGGGLHAFDAGGDLPRPDLLLVARGGGSLEDLWAFNEEAVVRAAAMSHIPLVSAVGHETDTTLIDFASDKRAPTPTAAAEIAAPLRLDLADTLSRASLANARAVRARLDQAAQGLTSAARGLGRAEDVLVLPRQRLDTAGADLPREADRRLADATARLERSALRLAARSPQARLTLMRQSFDAKARRLTPDLVLRAVHRQGQRLDGATARFASAAERDVKARHRDFDRQRLTPDLLDRPLADGRRRLDTLAARVLAGHGDRLERRREKLTRFSQLLDALSYRGVLARGYAVLRDGSGAPLASAGAVSNGQALVIELADGRVSAVAGGASRATKPKAKTPKVAKPTPDSSSAPALPDLFE